MLLPFIWSIIPSISLYSGSLGYPTNITNKQYFSDIFVKRPHGPTFLDMPPRMPFPWNNPNRYSFVERQNKNSETEDPEPTGPLKMIIEYHAQDSITFDAETKTFNIYGAGAIKYEDAQLTAENISLNWSNHTIIATGKVDDQGKINPKPVFQQGNTKYIAEEIRYNFESKRGTARKLFTKIEDGLVQADKAKMDIQDTYYADNTKFTTCNLTKPHYFIKLRNLKFVKDKRVASGPFQFYFDGVPTILGFFYGIFYLPTAKTSGIIRPQIGEDSNKGFYLKEGGYYFYLNDYIDLALTGSLYSKGDALFRAESNYKKRYAYNGKLFYQREVNAQDSDLALKDVKHREWRFKWNHNTDNNRVSSLAAEVDIQSRSQRRVLEEKKKPDQLNTKTNSKVRYTRKLSSIPYTFNTSITHSKNFKTDITHFKFPQVMLESAPIYLFRKGSRIPQYWYQNVYFKHTFEFESELTNMIGKDALEFNRKNWPKFLAESKYGAKHTIPIETNLKLFNYFNLKPSFQYTERWYFKQLQYKPGSGQDSISSDTLSGFYRVWDYSIGTELQTSIYGTHLFGEEATVQGIRHRINPIVDLTYRPDRSEYWQKIPTKVESLDKFKDAIYGTPKEKASALLTVKVDNNVELKVRDDSSSARKSKKIPIFESLSISTTYDFLADSFPLGDINLGARTRLLDNLISLECNSTFDPYIYAGTTRLADLAWQHGKGLGILKNYSFKIGTKLKSKKTSKIKTADLDDTLTNTDLKDKPESEEEKPTIALDPTQYVNFDVPWSLNLTYEQNYKYLIKENQKNTTRQLTFKGDIDITENWKFSFNTTYDFGKAELVGSATKLSIYRDLHCWQMSFDWSPLASKQSIDFSIGLKSSMLQDLKLPHNREYDKM